MGLRAVSHASAWRQTVCDRVSAEMKGRAATRPLVRVFYSYAHEESEEARKLYEQAVSRDPTLAHGYFRLGVIYDKLGQPDKALAMTEQAVARSEERRVGKECRSRWTANDEGK